MAYFIDVLLAGIALGVFIFLWGERLWGAALMFFNVAIAGLVAFNLYEPVAQILVDNVWDVGGYVDVLVYGGLFWLVLIALRVITDFTMPKQVRFPALVDLLGRVAFALGTGALAAAIVMTLFETAPVGRKVFGAIAADDRAPFNLGLDHAWLGFIEQIAKRRSGPMARGGRSVAPEHPVDFRAQTWLDKRQASRAKLFGGGGEGEGG
ncbi:MAG TPA: hypothetical protein VG406_12505 [Isosphaeraceae bacterium]|jgi:hypothetical protein|nr:hypothetical protein [Isosphaeraceae bacterium]